MDEDAKWPEQVNTVKWNISDQYSDSFPHKETYQWEIGQIGTDSIMGNKQGQILALVEMLNDPNQRSKLAWKCWNCLHEMKYRNQENS